MKAKLIPILFLLLSCGKGATENNDILGNWLVESISRHEITSTSDSGWKDIVVWGAVFFRGEILSIETSLIRPCPSADSLLEPYDSYDGTIPCSFKNNELAIEDVEFFQSSSGPDGTSVSKTAISGGTFGATFKNGTVTLTAEYEEEDNLGYVTKRTGIRIVLIKTDRKYDPGKPETPEIITDNPVDMKKINISAGGRSITATLEDNASAEAFAAKLKEGPLTVELSEYGGFEKVGPLGFNLPRNDVQVSGGPGDILLYQGNQLTIFYDTNSWSYTRLGKVDGLSQSELKSFLGDADVSVTFSL